MMIVRRPKNVNADPFQWVGVYSLCPRSDSGGLKRIYSKICGNDIAFYSDALSVSSMRGEPLGGGS